MTPFTLNYGFQMVTSLKNGCRLTLKEHMDPILRHGLLRDVHGRNRNHAHFAPASHNNITLRNLISRHHGIAVYINLPLALRDGFRFYRSRNGSILTPGIHGCVTLRYITKIVELRTDNILWPQETVTTAPTPTAN